MKKTITIDAKQYKEAIKAMWGGGRAKGDFERGFKRGLDEGEWVVRRLSNGWQFINGEWIEPTQESVDAVNTFP